MTVGKWAANLNSILLSSMIKFEFFIIEKNTILIIFIDDPRCILPTLSVQIKIIVRFGYYIISQGNANWIQRAMFAERSKLHRRIN